MKFTLSRFLPAALVAIALTFTASAFGQFTITDLHNFGSTSDGVGPLYTPVMDSAGNLYGVTAFGGTVGAGMAYELSPSASGWTETDLHNFPINDTSDASHPTAVSSLTRRAIFMASASLAGPTITVPSLRSHLVPPARPKPFSIFSPGAHPTEKTPAAASFLIPPATSTAPRPWAAPTEAGRSLSFRRPPPAAGPNR